MLNMMDLEFQERVRHWVSATFDEAGIYDVETRNHRFLEEALELAQSNGCTRDDAHQLVDYVFDRPKGLAKEEAGAVLLTLAALCGALRINMEQRGEIELHRVWQLSPQIRAKHLSRPANSPLPGKGGGDDG